MARRAMTSYDDKSDAELMRELADGQVEALAPLYKRHSAVVRSIAFRHLRGHPTQAVDDICQEVFLTLLEVAGRYHDEGKLRSFLCGITIRKARSGRRRERLRELLRGKWLGRDQAPAVAADTTRHDIERALATVPEVYREVLCLHVIDNLSTEEIAAALGIDTNTVWTRLHRARAKLKEFFADKNPGREL